MWAMEAVGPVLRQNGSGSLVGRPCASEGLETLGDCDGARSALRPVAALPTRYRRTQYVRQNDKSSRRELNEVRSRRRSRHDAWPRRHNNWIGTNRHATDAYHKNSRYRNHQSWCRAGESLCNDVATAFGLNTFRCRTFFFSAQVSVGIGAVG